MDLLLDTMCNTFGAVILITLLVALLTRGAREKEERSKASPAELEMLSRQIARAEQDLVGAKSAREVTVPSQRQDETVQIRELIVKTQLEMQEVESRISAAAGELAGIDSERLKKSLASLQASSQRLAAAQKRLSEGRDELRRISNEERELQDRFTKELDKRTVKLRLPRERAKTKTGLAIVLRYGEAFPLISSSGERNNISIQWEDVGDGKRAIPIRGRGIAVGDKAPVAWNNLLEKTPEAEIYLTFYVYSDSFGAFRVLKEAAVTASLDYGGEPIEGDKNLIFSDRGTSPPPL